ncbi:acetate/propionate family kinase [Leptolyngbya sp. NIES-2104]|uniref:acetate/propionate family kinase n=1 Tax=Leptolyngbya sp. NIES-2104 TaxID=1552121 RepID=UPI0006EC4394|nr:acetate kinase [Leptolyngbya sp. NIES-2104]GAP98848.1 acetate kinase [Leptolyngbya sp. NIES-2104]
MKILVLNAGSSSQKSCLYELTEPLPNDPPAPLWEAQIDWTAQAGKALLKIKANGKKIEQTIDSSDQATDTLQLLKTLSEGDTKVIQHSNEVDVVGHRIVHGGQSYRQSVRIDQTVKDTIADLARFAPLHNPANLQGIEAIEQSLGNVPQVAVFDTAFHSTLSAAASLYPIPYEWYEKGVQRYGFHGISHQYCANRAAQLLEQDLHSLKLITCHLGNGCSSAAIRNGQSIDTTMGFTPLEGLMMGSRSGSIDPGVVLYLMREDHYSIDEVEKLLNKQSGLLGVSGVSSDLRQVVNAETERSTLAIETYIHRLRSNIGAMIASLEGLDAIVFTAGVGENSAMIRSRTCEAFRWLGLELDEGKNQASPVDQNIAALSSKVQILVIHTEEDWAIAQECWKLAR